MGVAWIVLLSGRRTEAGAGEGEDALLGFAGDVGLAPLHPALPGKGVTGMPRLTMLGVVVAHRPTGVGVGVGGDRFGWGRPDCG